MGFVSYVLWLRESRYGSFFALFGWLSDHTRPRTSAQASKDLFIGIKSLIPGRALHPYRHTINLGVGCAEMKSRGVIWGAGERIKALRVNARMTTREVEKLSLEISKSKRNPE